MLQINHLYKSYGKFAAVKDLNLHIAKGESFGFVGPNGAGKTTTMRIVAGLLQQSSGEIIIDGQNYAEDIQSMKRKIGYMPDFFGVYDNLKVMEYMEFYASMYGMVGESATTTCRELVDLVNLSDKEDFYVDSLSRGMKQRLCLARALVHNPDLLILDEPASGLDPRARFEMKEIIKNLTQMEKTVLISSHILPELAQMCTSLGVIEHGRLILEGTVDEILHHSQENAVLEVKVLGDQQKAIELIKANPLVEKILIQEDFIKIYFSGTEEDEAKLLSNLVENQILVSHFVKNSGDIEELFLEITAQEEED